ncbi:DUF742 domain-containing protein [Pseudonocardia sp. 73-21]|uniref:DUF742 domain-containing protein n=1 Tax=Pseudonocardia sp. 73-21 TaxID=1895809 RepID=UPI000A79ADC9|nr:DUF742 domain-containing protein [Pseudonocardia sp. 73-21]
MRAQDGPEVGLTGARFGGGGRRRGRRNDAAGDAGADTVAMAAVEPLPEPPAAFGSTAPPGPEAPVVGLTGARFGGPSPRRRRVVPRPVDAAAEAAEVGEPVPRPRPVGWREPPPDADAAVSSFVRPYVLTSGRTRSTFDLAIEALVSVVPAALGARTPHPDIVELCREPRSVAEIAALRGVPLGVARVLLGDLAALGAVVVHRTVDAGGPDLALMERVLSGLRRL